MCPLVEGPRAELRAVVAGNRLRVAPSPGYAIKLFDHSGARKAQRRNQARTIAVVRINDRQRPEPSSVFEPIRDEVHRPALVGLLRYTSSGPRCWLASFFRRLVLTWSCSSRYSR